MAGGKHNHKRGAKNDRKGHNPINSRPPREHIVIIGGPCNTFNAWWSWVDLQSQYEDSGEDGFWSPQPAPKTMRDLKYYLRTKPGVVTPRDAKNPETWRRAGWSKQGRKDMEERMWDPDEIESEGPETHDLYWANFIDPAVRLYSKSTSFKAPLRRPRIRRGDIVTFMIYAPAYEMRQSTDYSASPFNMDHRNKFGIKGNPQYDPTAPKNPRRNGSSGGSTAVTEENKREEAHLQREREKARAGYKDQPLSGQDLDHYILMSTTSDNKGDVIKRPPNNYCYYDYLETIIDRAVPANDVMTKTLFFSNPQQVLHYMGDGSWAGEPIERYVDEWRLEQEETEEEKQRIERNRRRLDEFYNINTDSKYGLTNYQYTPPVPQYKDTQGRPLKWKLYWNRFWKGAPSVDRKKIKIARLDYFGHSADEELMLEWGWDNKKGELPELGIDPVTKDEICLTAEHFEAVLTGGQLTSDALATLWGCNTGESCAPKMAEYFGGGVVATETFTDFSKIVHNETNMPFPSDGEPWIHYTADKAQPVGAP